MRSIHSRVAKLEASGTVELSPWLKQWLGRALTDEERAIIAANPEPPQRPVDTSGFSKELKRWLGTE